MPSSAYFGIWSGGCTFAMYVRARPEKGVGDYNPIQVAWPGCNTSDLMITSTDGLSRPLSWPNLVVAIHQHLLNSNLLSYWSAPMGASSSELRRVLEEIDPSALLGNNRTLCLWFDGPNGPASLSIG